MSRKLGTLEIYTHGVRVLGIDDRVKVAARRVLNNWVVKAERKVENSRGELVPELYVTQLYGAAFKNQNDFWFHKGQMKEFETELQVVGLAPVDLEIKVIPVHAPSKVKFKLREGRVLRDYQEDAKAFCLNPVKEGDHASKLVGMPVGTGKTVTSCGTAAENGQRWVIGVLPKYGKKWCEDVFNNLDLDKKQIMFVEKTTQLRGVIDMCKTQGTRKLPPVVIITLSILRMFYDAYEEDPEGCIGDMGCAPWELMGILDSGMFAIDEAHEHIHTVFRTAMYLHGVKFIAMSGTMRTEDAFQEKVQNTIFPQIKRYLDVKMKKYIDVKFIGYNFDPSIVHKMRYQAFGRNDYNHPTLEKSIMKLPHVFRDYLNMVTELLDSDYIPRYKGNRALIFVGTVEMADKMILALTSKYPFLKISRYCAAQGDKYEDLRQSDLTVSTLQSSGTAVDIPNLITCICTTMVNSSKTNIQALGRLREIAGVRVAMFMPYCKQIKKHLKYMAFRHELFKDITKSIKTFNYNVMLGRGR